MMQKSWEFLSTYFDWEDRNLDMEDLGDLN